MNNATKPSALLPLFGKLRECPSRDERITEKRLADTWSRLKEITPEHGDTITPAVVAGVILYHPQTFALLLNDAEQAQLQALGKVALERYLQLTNPPNILGKTIAAALKEDV